MAEVFDYAEGMRSFEGQLERVIAMHKTVQRRLDAESRKIQARAEANLAKHRDTGNSFIGIAEGDVDRYVFLEDPPRWRWTKDGQYREDPGAAWDIEHGHQAPDGSWVEGTWVLHDAARIPRGI